LNRDRNHQGAGIPYLMAMLPITKIRTKKPRRSRRQIELVAALVYIVDTVPGIRWIQGRNRAYRPGLTKVQACGQGMDVVDDQSMHG
jgi:hypothetical protein